MKKAVSLAKAGQLVLLRGGVYKQQERITNGGTNGAPITVAAYPGERPVFDGSGIALARNEGLVHVTASDLIFDGIEVRNSTARGFFVYNSDRVTLRRSYVHHIRTKGYAGTGDDLVVEDNVFEELVTGNAGGRGLRPWPAGISTWHRPDGRAVKGFVFRNNQVKRVWGECVISLFTVNSEISGNRISNCHSVGIYVDNARDVLIERNTVRSTTDEFNRVDNGKRMTGINIAVENYSSSGSIRSEDIVVRNNLILGTDRGINFYYDKNNTSSENSYRDLTLAHNVICNTVDTPIKFATAEGSYPSNNKLMNNVMCKGQTQSVTDLVINQDSAWTISHNSFPNGTGSKSGANSVTGDPGFLNSGGTNLASYKLRNDSKLIGAGVVMSDVERDAFCALRKTQPSIGLHEM